MENNGIDWKAVASKLLSRRIIADCGHDSPCWLYEGCRNPDGYGQMRVGGMVAYTHRISASCFKGFDLKSPELVKHNCNNPPCFNPAHLEPDDHTGNNGDIADDGNHRNSGALSDTQVRELIRTVRYRGWPVARWAVRNHVKYSTARNAYLGLTHFFLAVEMHRKCDRYCQSDNPLRRGPPEEPFRPETALDPSKELNEIPF